MDKQLTYKRALLPRLRRVVIKIGSSILSDARGIDHVRFRQLVDEIQAIGARGLQVVVVSSGAVAAGMGRLKLKERPRTIPQKQAVAAVGQIGLMALYEKYFGAHGQAVAQVLLTHEDLANRRRYINARHSFEALLQAEVVPVVNENDTVAVEEVRFNFGDNDNLSALVATLVSADLLVMLSDVAGLYTTDPRLNSGATLVGFIDRITPDVKAYVSTTPGPLGIGGMTSKLEAAYKATAAGIPCWVADGTSNGVLEAIFDPAQSVGTLFCPTGDRLKQRKFWIAHTLKPMGTITVDAGANIAIVEHGRSLLPKGIALIEGSFGAGECVSCLDPSAREFARGLVNYGSSELAKIKGLHSNAIESALGYKVGDEIIHRDDLVVLGTSQTGAGR